MIRGERIMRRHAENPADRRYCPRCGYLLPIPTWDERTRCPECGGEFVLHELSGLPPRGRFGRIIRAAIELAPGILRLVLAAALAAGLAFLLWCLLMPGVTD
jgi:ribosomal protein S27AE